MSSVDRRGQALRSFRLAPSLPWALVFFLTWEIHTRPDAGASHPYPPQRPPTPHSPQQLREIASGWAPPTPPSPSQKPSLPPRLHVSTHRYLRKSEQWYAAPSRHSGRDRTQPSPQHRPIRALSFPARRGRGRKQPMGVKPLKVTAN